MKAVRMHRPGGVSALRFEDAPVPHAGVGDVLIEVHAASFTPGELGWPLASTDRVGRDRTPAIPGHEVSGVVVELGFGTTGFEVGDRVFGVTDRYRDGAMAEFMAAEARDLATLPDGLGHLEAAALAMPGLTARQGLFTHGRLSRGQVALVVGAGGGVGAMAVQLATQTGAAVIGIGHERDREVIQDLGATFLSATDHLEHGVESPVDLVFDTVGGQALARAQERVVESGTVVSIASPPQAMAGHRSTYFIVEANREHLAALAEAAGAGVLRSHVGPVFALESAVDAFIEKERGVPGKFVVVTGAADWKGPRS